MKKFTHAELAAAQERGDWDLLWQQAMPLVKLVVGRMGRSGAVRNSAAKPGTRDDDLLQQGMLIAGEAMRQWKPLECAFTTHIGNAVRWKLYEFLGRRHNHGIGSHVQRPAVFNTSDSRDGLYGFNSVDYDEGDEDDDGSFEAALTYAGVIRPNGQYDGCGYTPEGFGDPSEEADKHEQQVRAALQHLTDGERRAICAIYGIGEPACAPSEYAAKVGVSESTLKRTLSNAKAILALRLPGFRSQQVRD
ncbi:MAG TPA: hypothetical protein VJQ52_03955 [Steroidobacteraceae bacterium]|nr:hypothetical protein [Steroidobacteraceae bacterium]